MSHTEAMNAPICCTGDCNQGRTCPRNAPWHSRNGGNTVTNGQALKPVYDGDDVIDEPMPAHVFVGLVACGLLFLVCLGWLVVRVAS